MGRIESDPSPGQGSSRDPDLVRSQPSRPGRRADAGLESDGITGRRINDRRASELPRNGDNTRTGRVGDRPGLDRLDGLDHTGVLAAGYGDPRHAAAGRPPPHGSPARDGHPGRARGPGAVPRASRANATEAPWGPSFSLPVKSVPGRPAPAGHSAAGGRGAEPARYLRPRTGASGPPRRAVEPAPATGHGGAVGAAAALGVVAADRGDGRGGLRRFCRRIRRGPGPICRPPARAGRAPAAPAGAVGQSG